MCFVSLYMGWVQFDKTVSSYKVCKCNEKTQRCELRTTISRCEWFCETGRIIHCSFPLPLGPIGDNGNPQSDVIGWSRG